MSRHRKSRYPITDTGEATAERVRLGGDILIGLAHAVAKNEQTQQRFWFAVFNKLARIEARLGLVHLSQLARNQQEVQCLETKLLEDSQAAEECVSLTC